MYFVSTRERIQNKYLTRLIVIFTGPLYVYIYMYARDLKPNPVISFLFCFCFILFFSFSYPPSLTIAARHVIVRKSLHCVLYSTYTIKPSSCPHPPLTNRPRHPPPGQAYYGLRRDGSVGRGARSAGAPPEDTMILGVARSRAEFLKRFDF